MKMFRVYKVGGMPAEICGGAERFTLAGMCDDLYDHTGYDSLEHMRAQLREWGDAAKAGDSTKTRTAVIVCEKTR